MSYGSSGINGNAGSAMRFSQTRGRIQGGAGYGLNYPNPFFDVAHTYLPTTVKQMFRWCRYYFLTNPLINTVVFKMSEYPITDLVIDHPDREVVKRWTEYFQDHLRYRAFQVETGLDYNCVSGDTRVVTEEGVFPIRELVGRTVRVLSQGGVYREAAFKSYGQQRLWEVHTDDGVLFATEEHRWLVQSPKGQELRETTTRQLKGKRVPRVVAPRPEQGPSFWDGVRHGVIFGDGTLSNEGKQAHVCLVPQEKRYLARYFEAQATITPHHDNKYLGVYGLPPEYKQPPSATASAAYWYGFTCGLLATDGSVDNRGQTVLTQKDPAILLEIAKRLPWFGIVGGRVREHTAWSQYTKQMEPMNYLSLKTQSLQGQDFVRPDQRAAFEKFFEPTGYGSFVGVKKVVVTNRVEEVFCCEEPETHSFVIENGLLTGNCYGNCLVSLGYPFVKYLTCRVCKNTEQADKLRPYWQLVNYEFRMTCPKCGQTAEASAKDSYNKSASGVKMIRWNPEDVEITYNDITGDYSHFYTVPSTVRNDIVMGKKDVVEKIPQIFIQALKEQKGIIFSKQNLFHLRRPTLATQDRGWGIPLLLPVLKDVFYLQIMKKAQECVAPETLLETQTGLRAASEIQVGELVKTHLGTFSPIVAKRVKPMIAERGDYAVQLTTTGLRQLPSTFSDNHPLYVLRRNEANRRRDTKDHRRSSYVLRNPSLYDFTWVDAGNVRVGDYIGYPTQRARETTEVDLAKYVEMTTTENFVYTAVSPETARLFEETEAGNWVPHTNEGRTAKNHRNAGSTPKRLERRLELDESLSYIAGWYVGDGSIGARRVDFSMGPDDDGVELKEAIASVFGVNATSTPCPDSNGWMLVASETIFSEFMKGWIPGTAPTKRIPDEIMSAPDAVVLEFLRGYLEADGYVDHVRERVTVTCSNNGLLYQIRSLLLSLGCVSTIAETESYAVTITNNKGKQTHLTAGRPVFSLYVYRKSARRLLDLLLHGSSDEVVTSGKSGFFHNGYFATRVSSVEVVDCPEVISFEVANEHTFCVPGMATHNTVLLEHALPLRVLFPQAGSGSSDPYCVSPATLVETPVGLLPASEVRAGDYLRSHTGAWRAVEATKTRPIAAEEKVFRFKVASLAAFPFEVSEEHPILAVPCVSRKRPRQGLVDPAFIPAQELKKGDYVAYPVKRIVRGPQELDLADYVTRSVTDAWVYRRLNQETAEIYEWMESTGDLKFAWGERKKLLDARGWSDANYCTAYSMRQEGSIDRVPRYLPVTKELACLVGYFLAEGSMRDTLATFALHLKEEHYASEIEHAVLHLGFRGVSHSERVSQNGREVCVDDVILSELLSSLCGTGFANKRIPDVLSEAEDNLVLGMLRCLFNGDGTYFETDTIRLGLKLANPSVILEARRLLLSFGYIGGVMKEEPTATSLHKTTSYQLNFNGESAKHVSLLLRGLEDYNPRPAQRSGVIRGDYVLLRIDEMEPIDSVPEVIGFQMAEDKSFCVAGVATHNTSINLVEWREHVAAEVGRWRNDPAYIPIMPLPIGHQVIGGDGKALMLNAEIQQWSDSIVAGMGVPREFVYGGLTWSGSNVSLRMLENMFLGYLLRQKAMARWVMQEVSSFLDWPVANIRFKPFKMADDMQRKAYNFQLNSAGKLSDTTLLADSDYSQDDENEIMKNETANRLEATKLQQVAMAEIQGEQSVIMAKYQVKAQQITMQAQQAAIAPGEPGGPEDDGSGGTAGGQEATSGGAMPQGMESGLSTGQRLQPGQAGGDLQAMAYMQAKTIAAMPPNQQAMAIQNLYAQSPELGDLVTQALRSMGVQVAPGGGQGPQAPGAAPANASNVVDLRPLPEQRSPRREMSSI